jgi:hypothetical protein
MRPFRFYTNRFNIGPPPVRQRKAERVGLALLTEAHTDVWFEREDLGSTLLLCPGKMFRQVNLYALSLLRHIQRYLIMYFEALHLLLIFFILL